MKKEVVSLARGLRIKNITFLDPVPKEEVPRYLSVCVVSLAPLKNSDTFKSVIPSKIFEASAMEKPTLLGVEGQAQEIIERYNAGLCFEPENEVDFIEKATRMKNDRKLYAELQHSCRRLITTEGNWRKKCWILLPGLLLEAIEIILIALHFTLQLRFFLLY